MPIAVLTGDDGKVMQPSGAIDLPASSTIGGVAVSALGVVTSTSATALAVGRQGATNPVLNINANTASVVTGVTIVGAAAAAAVAVAVTSSGTNESLTVDAKGTGAIKLNSVGGTGAVQMGGAASGSNATGITVTPAAAASGVAIAVVSTGTNESVTIDAKGSGTILLNATATGAVLVGDATNPAFSVVHTSEGTGVKVTSAAAASGVAVAAISSGTDENLTIDAKGAGTISLNATGTGAIVLGRVARVKSITVAVAAAGTTVADAAALGAANIVHITSDGAGKGVKFPAAVLGDFMFLINDSATAAEFYANDGGTVNGLGADASVVIPASKGLFVQATAADTLIAFDLPAKATAS